MNGEFVISLDFELHWGVFDVKSVENYKENLIKVRSVIPRLLELADAYDIKLTFSTVGFLFAENKTMLKKFSPEIRPSYVNEKLNPYLLIDSIGENEKEDPYHYAHSLIKFIQENGNHEIGTHTFSHYYCKEEGQTPEDFEKDIIAAIEIANTIDVELRSIVFPRNMIRSDLEGNTPYLDICKKYGINSYRGNENSKIYDVYTTVPYRDNFVYRIMRILDCYFNITGFNTYNVKELNSDANIYNFPSSRFLRPYCSFLKIFEPWKVSRIKRSMRHAAKNNQLFHLWWHPHNFGTHMDENFKNLEEIFKEHVRLKQSHNFKSETMTSLADNLSSYTSYSSLLFYAFVV